MVYNSQEGTSSVICRKPVDNIDEDKQVEHDVPKQIIKGFDNRGFECDYKSPTDRIDHDFEEKDAKTTEAEIQLEIKSAKSPSLCLKICVLIGSCYMVILSCGYFTAQGVLFVGIMEEFNSNRAETSPAVSSYTVIVFGLGGLLGPMMNRIDGGILCIIGAIIAFGGCIISVLSTSIPILILGNGIFVGVGLSAPFLYSFIIVGELFDKNRLNMLMIVGFSPGVSLILLPYVTSALMDIYTWRGALLIYGGLILNIIPIGLLDMYIKRRLNQQTSGGRTKSFREMLDLSLFKKMDFLVLVFCTFLFNSLFPIITMFFIDMVAEKGIDRETGSIILSINGMVNLGARVVAITILRNLKVNRMAQWSFYLLMASTSITMYAVFETYDYLLGTSILYGFFWGLCAISYPPMMMETVGPKRYSNAMGYCNFIGGIFGLFNGPVAGFIRDATGSYNAFFYSATGLGIIGSALLMMAVITKGLREKRRQRKLAAIVESFSALSA